MNKTNASGNKDGENDKQTRITALIVSDRLRDKKAEEDAAKPE